MANEKYDNLTALMSEGRFNWATDDITALLVEGATFDAADVTTDDLGALVISSAPVPGRVIAADGAMLGLPVAFEGVGKGHTFQMVFYRYDGFTKALLTWYDVDDQDEEIRLKNNGTLILRPTPISNPLPPLLGTWVGF